jgi:hypothetical protein
MYEKLDSFMATDTWHTRHPSDEKRFFMMLHELLKNRKFQPGSDGGIHAQRGRIDADDRLYQAIDHYTAAAWAVKGYVEANNL